MTGRPDPMSSPSSGKTPDFARLAELIASGGHPFPSGLTKAEEKALVDAVRKLRRLRLIRLVARAIAADIVRSHAKDEDPPC